MSGRSAHHVAEVAYRVDELCRLELSLGTLNDERQYVAALAVRIRDYWACAGQRALCYAKALPSRQERLLGCDALILLRLDNGYKVGLFEAKWPRLFQNRSHSWDSFQAGTNVSHYSDQLIRQSKIHPSAAVWELLMNEEAPGKYTQSFDTWGATCLWHAEARLYMAGRPHPNAVWSRADARSLVYSVARRKKNLATCVKRLAECREGKLVAPTRGAVSISSGEKSSSIPVGTAEFEAAAPEVALALGLSAILLLDLTPNPLK